MVTYTEEVAYPQERDSRALWNLSTRPKGNTGAKTVGSVGRSQASLQLQYTGTSILTVRTPQPGADQLLRAAQEGHGLWHGHLCSWLFG